MAARPRTSISERLNAAQVAISNTLGDAEIQAAVAKFGYPAAKMQVGRDLHNTAVVAVNVQTAAEGAQQHSSAEAEAAQKSAREACQALAKVARAVFARDRGQLVSLGLTGRMPTATADFLTSAYSLFDNALRVDTVKTTLAEYGYNEAKLTSERALVEAFDRANQAQQAAVGAAQQATRDQATALTALDTWLAQFLKIAQVALKSKKELLEKLGVRTLSAKTAAQRGAPAKAAATRAAKRSTAGK